MVIKVGKKNLTYVQEVRKLAGAELQMRARLSRLSQHHLWGPRPGLDTGVLAGEVHNSLCIYAIPSVQHWQNLPKKNQPVLPRKHRNISNMSSKKQISA